jgi:hypothetical protein
VLALEVRAVEEAAAGGAAKPKKWIVEVKTLTPAQGWTVELHREEKSPESFAEYLLVGKGPAAATEASGLAPATARIEEAFAEAVSTVVVTGSSGSEVAEVPRPGPPPAGGASQGGASQGGASQGGASQGGASQGGASQGGASEGSGAGPGN